VPGSGPLTIAPSDAIAKGLFQRPAKADNDVPTAPSDPQTLNRYSYVENQPLIATDPSGHCSGGSVWNNLASTVNGTCFRKGMVIMANARSVDEWALGLTA
jgi:hypothetical protein